MCIFQPSALIGALAFKGLKFCSWKLCYTPSRERQSRLEEEMLEVGWVDPLHELVYAVPIVQLSHMKFCVLRSLESLMDT